MIVLPQTLDLRLSQSGKTKHADLIGDMLPRPGGALCLETLSQSLAHVRNPTTHRAQILLPHREQLRIVQHTTGNVGAVGWGVGDLRPLQHGELAGNVARGRCGVGAGCADEMESARALAVETEVLGEGLGDAQLEALFDEVADGPGVADEITGCETLVGAVEEGEVVALAHSHGDVLPLFLSGVDTGGIMGAGVEEDDGTWRGSAQGGNHAIEVEALGLRGEVGVVGEGEADIGEDLVVVGPGWRGEVEGGLVGMKARQEETSQVDGARAGDGLKRADAVFADGRTVGAHDELLGGGDDICQALDGEVFVERGFIVDVFAGLSISRCFIVVTGGVTRQGIYLLY